MALPIRPIAKVRLTRFDLFFPERRPFFLENSGFYEFGTAREVEIFFTRRIGIDKSGVEVPIDADARVTGKAGHYEIGVLNMLTRDVDGVTPRYNYTVVRVSRELRNHSSVGLIAVNKQAASSLFDTGQHEWNRTFGADYNIGIGRNTNIFNYAAKSLTPGVSGSDYTYASSMTYDDDNDRVDAGYIEVGENFNPEVGFVRRLGYRRPRPAIGTHTTRPAAACA